MKGPVWLKCHKRLFFLAAAVLALLTGCAEQASSSPAASGDTQPAVSAFPTLKYYTIGTPDRDLKRINDALNALLEKKCGLHVEYIKIGWGDYGRTLTSMISAGSDFDLAFATNLDQGDYLGNAKKGVWLALDPYLKTIGKDMYAAIDPHLWAGMKIGGKIYGVPTNKEIAVPEWWIYDKSLVDKYRVDVTQYRTLESLEPLFRTIKRNEPDYIVMELDQYSHNFFALENYEYLLNKSVPLMVISTEKRPQVVNVFETELATRTLATLRKYYKAGYINEDASLRADAGPATERRTFWREGGAGPNANASWAKDFGYEVVAQQVTDSIVTTESARGGIIAVNARTRYPEECIAFLNALNTDPDIRNLLNFGLEGVHYDLTPEGQVEVRKDSNYVGVQYTLGNWFILKTMKGDPPNKWDIYKEFNRAAVKSEVLDFVPDISSPEISTQIAAVSAVTEKYYPALMTGTVDPEIELPRFLAELKAAGVDELKAVFQRQLDDWKAAELNGHGANR